MTWAKWGCFPFRGTLIAARLVGINLITREDMDSTTRKTEDILDTIRKASFEESEQEFLIHAIMAMFKRNWELTTLLNKAEDRQTYNDRIIAAVKLARGPAFGFSGHGILKTIDGKFSDEKKAAIVRKMHEFSQLLETRLGVQSFITSGTLLGLVREGRFLAHDDDFDMAYVSCHEEQDKIIAERRKIFDVVNEADGFTMKERTGGRAAIFVKADDVEFHFDLFAGYGEDGKFNEFPLKPGTVSMEDIVPVKSVEFYGEQIYVPKHPEKLLVLNYGEEWKVPDPAFRFSFGEHRHHYNFLIKNKFTELEK